MEIRRHPAKRPAVADEGEALDRVRLGRGRAVVDAVRPRVPGECGTRFAVKRVVGERVDVEADVLTDGHDMLGCELRYRRRGDEEWHRVRMRAGYNDTWHARFTPDEIGAWEFAVEAWVDPFITWAHDLRLRVNAGQDIAVDLEIGASIVDRVAEGSEPDLAAELRARSQKLRAEGVAQRERAEVGMGDDLARLMWEASPRRFADLSEPVDVWVDRRRAQFSAWYEMFPRSAAAEAGRHGTLRDVVAHLPYVQQMGFDVLYLPPISPIGRTARKGPNNTAGAGPDDPGSPWAIGGPEGGHTSIHPELGTLADFDELVAGAEARGLEIALDIAFQCSPDHPWVREHPQWFKHRPDGSIQYAENPPKKYQDIYPLDFECEDWQGLWRALREVFEFWIDRGVKIFRVDNPHTKPFRFWDWVIGSIRERHPDVIFLSEAFTRPKMMYRLAKGGFTQSYTYFAWRNGAWDLRQYLEELSRPPVVDFFRPNFWPNTPDILTEYLQKGGRPAGMARLVLAATLSPSYGIYGPVFELCEYTPRPGAEENLNSEKYEVRHWNRDDPWSLRHLVALINRIRRENPALQQLRDLTFHYCDNPAHIAYSKRSADGLNTILCVVNTDPHQTHWGLVRLNLDAIGVDAPFHLTDLLTDDRYTWHGADNAVGLEPGRAHIFRIDTPQEPVALG